MGEKGVKGENKISASSNQVMSKDTRRGTLGGWDNEMLMDSILSWECL